MESYSSPSSATFDVSYPDLDDTVDKGAGTDVAPASMSSSKIKFDVAVVIRDFQSVLGFTRRLTRWGDCHRFLCGVPSLTSIAGVRKDRSLYSCNILALIASLANPEDEDDADGDSNALPRKLPTPALLGKIVVECLRKLAVGLAADTVGGTGMDADGFNAVGGGGGATAAASMDSSSSMIVVVVDTVVALKGDTTSLDTNEDDDCCRKSSPVGGSVYTALASNSRRKSCPTVSANLTLVVCRLNSGDLNADRGRLGCCGWMEGARGADTGWTNIDVARMGPESIDP